MSAQEQLQVLIRPSPSAAKRTYRQEKAGGTAPDFDFFPLTLWWFNQKTYRTT